MKRFLNEVQDDFRRLFERHRMAIRLLGRVAEYAEEVRDEKLCSLLDEGVEDLLLITLQDSKEIRRKARELDKDCIYLHDACKDLIDELKRKEYDNDIRREQD